MTAPHQGQPLLQAGQALAQARAALVLVHGRGGSAADMLTLAAELAHPGFAYLAPQAAGNTWYPFSFLAPLEDNEPGISSGIEAVRAAVAQAEGAGIPAERIMVLGFSQGACLTLEFAARTPRRYGGLVALTGGLIGPEGTPRDYPGSLAGTPIFIGSSDPDAHVPVARVRESTAVLQRLGGQVTQRIYPGMGHTINADEIAFARGMMDFEVDQPAGE
ncbi:MAG: phospholipase [Anaerolineae bacterium]|nr:phospholipase [Anaerolineae bacterium]